MRVAACASLFSLLMWSCVAGSTAPQLLPPEHALVKQSSTQVAAGRLTTYSVEGALDFDKLSTFPVSNSQRWKVRRWTEEVTQKELASLAEFLSNERSKYATSGRYEPQVSIIDSIIAVLSTWPNNRESLVSYQYTGDRPGSADYLYGEWLYLYYLDKESATITEITNAFR